MNLNNIQPKTKIIGKKLHYVTSCHSTNDLSAEIIQNTADFDGLCVFTDFQTAGKGQMGNTWEAQNAQNILCSILLDTSSVILPDSFYLSKCTALACRATLAFFLRENVEIKWPNDIVCQNLKISGILIENKYSGSKLNASVLGIGINVNQEHFENQKASSMHLLKPTQVFDRASIMNFLFEKLEYYFDLLKTGQVSKIDDEYQQHLFRKDLESTFKTPSGENIFGKIKSVTPSGKLEVETRNQSLLFDLKEISLVF